MVEEAGRGRRRVVPSPRPRRIVEAGAIRALLDADLVVIAAGGGGIRVIETAPGVYRGVEAVVDKDLASSLLTAGLGLPVLVLSTGVPKVAVWFRRPAQRDLDRVTVSEAGGSTPTASSRPGAWGRRCWPPSRFAEQGGREAIVTSPDHLDAAVVGHAGMHACPTERGRRPMTPWSRSAPRVPIRVRATDDGARDDRLPARLRRSRRLRGGFGQRRLPPPAGGAPGRARLLGGAGGATARGPNARGPPPRPGRLPPSKKARGKLKVGIGDPGPMGRILVGGEYGHDIVTELSPEPSRWWTSPGRGRSRPPTSSPS